MDGFYAIDPHVHCRDNWDGGDHGQTYKETIWHVLKVAEKQGVKKIFDMPNTDPPILDEDGVRERLELVPEGRKRDYFLYVGLTANEKQLQQAVRCYGRFPEVIGLKLFAGESTGGLGIIDPEDQREIYRVLSRLGYEGVLAVHCEKESCMRRDLWDPSNPVTHARARPKEAEIEAVWDQINFATQTGFKGILHICHVSCPQTVEIIKEEATLPESRITCGVTPHHVLWDDSMLERPDGLLYKTNPPLRSRDDVEMLRRQLAEGMIDWIESDHAPHAVGEKMHDGYPSGYPSLYLYGGFVGTFLPGLGLTEEQIRKLTRGNIARTFRKLDLTD